ncbi:MAG: hypothetical protein JWQ43_3772, partial [Glaciihabitans sp.]|nr:hypothetical protein [Glaciihabitans sp.]
TTVGLALGAALGSAAVDYATTLPALALMGLLTGTVLGIAQALALPAPATGHPRTGTHRRWPWIAITAALWTLGWTITTLAGINVDEQFVVFGASGAIVYATLSGVALQLLSPASKSTPTSDQGARK